MRGVYNQTNPSATESGVMYGSSPSDTSFIQPWTPPPTQSVYMDDFETSTKRGAISGPLYFTPTMEGTSMVPFDRGSISSRSDFSEFDHSGKLHLSTPRNFPGRRSFMSKPIHPLSFPLQSPTLETSGLFEYDSSTPLRDTHRLSSGSSSIDLADMSERLDPGRPSNPCGSHKCGVCDRLLSQRSPWSSRRIIKSGDMPVTGVLFCRHVFHAECLEQTTPKSHTSDPPCPICAKVEGVNSSESEQIIFPKTRNSFPRLRGVAVSGEGSSKSWGCIQVGDCVEGAHRSSMLLLNRNKMKKNLSLKGNSGKEFPGKPKKSGTVPLNFLGGRFAHHGTGGCSKTSAGLSIKK
ncbi:uncharacterized protein LOC141598759 [Silene latifolia]|uniref:uncharacterized protein LOC141598759 n=1 Tax=Silene latifolia TaxID=37657 RepID=UPI003D76C442